MTRLEAIESLADLGWELSFADVREAGTVLDEVTGTDPAAGVELDVGSPLTLFVSLGEPLVDVPDVAGLTVTDARDQLTRQGLRVGDIRDIDDETVPAGLVIRAVSPGQAAELEPGESVDLLVSTGPAQRIVPALPATGSPSEAGTSLIDLRLVPVEDHEFSDTVALGQVIRFEPSPGAFVAADSEVVIVVSDGPAPREVPAVIGLDVDEATAILEDAGFVVVGVQGSPSLPVLATDPKAGEVHAVGTEIVIATSLSG